MSKRSWLPTQKGTELYPKATHIPTVLRIKDVKPGTELYTAVANEFDGQLKQFHGKAQHAHALSSNPITKMRAQFGGEARATYTNIQGSETLELEVSRSTLEKLNKQQGFDYWDFALVELVVPSIYDAYDFKAMGHLTVPTEQKIVPGLTWPVAGLATNFLTKDVADHIINAAESDDSVRTVPNTTGDDRIFSVTVDLRPARGLPAFNVDLHAAIVGRQEVIPISTWLTPTGAQVSDSEIPHDSGGDPLSISDYDFVMGNQPLNPPIGSLNQTFNGGTLPSIWITSADGFHTGWPDYSGKRHTVAEVGGGSLQYSNLPPIEYDSSTHTWLFSATHNAFYNEFLGNTAVRTVVDLPPIGKHDESDTSHGNWRHWYIASGDYTSGYSGPALVPAEVQVTLFKGVPRLSVSNYGDFYRWDFTETLPLRPSAMMLSRPAVPALTADPFVNDPSQLFNLPKLGTLTIMSRMDRGVSWKPAT